MPPDIIETCCHRRWPRSKKENIPNGATYHCQIAPRLGLRGSRGGAPCVRGCTVCGERQLARTSGSPSSFIYIDELHPENVFIGDNSTIGLRTSIFTHFYWGPRKPKNNARVVIEKNVFIGPHCVILPNVRIGEGAVVRAGTMVSRNVPPHTMLGSPLAEPWAGRRCLLPPNTHIKNSSVG